MRAHKLCHPESVALATRPSDLSSGDTITPDGNSYFGNPDMEVWSVGLIDPLKSATIPIFAHPQNG